MLSRNKNHRTHRPLTMESLGDRRMMAADINLVDGVLEIEGTDERDIIRIRDAGRNSLSVTVQDGAKNIRTDDDGNPLSLTVARSQVRGIHVDAGRGDDLISNSTRVGAEIEAGTGNDTVYGGKGSDRIDGQSGNDLIYGSSGDDVLNGGWGRDKIYGQSGNDILRGHTGDDDLFGGGGDDSLYGGGGVDRLFGQSGADGLFGGYGVDWLDLGSGSNRYLLDELSSEVDDVNNVGSDDARIWFKNTGAVTRQFPSLGPELSSFAAESWTQSEIEMVDSVLAELHAATKNTNLLKTAHGGDLQFRNQGVWLSDSDGGTDNSGVSGWNSGNGLVTIVEDALDGSNWMRQTIIHEIGHNFDSPYENFTIGQFRDLSGWTNKASHKVWVWGKGWDYIQNDTGTNQKDFWWHTMGADNFTREYGRTNPQEDFATSFAAFFLQDDFTGAPANGSPNIGADAAPDKMNYMESFIAIMS